jgi:pyruvate kinase
MRATVVRGGPISSRKGITYTDSAYRIESICEADQAVLAQTRALPGIRYALSYIKDAEEMARYRRQIGPDAYLIAKIERPQAVEQAVSVAASANEVWLCRGDLGAELGLPAMAAAAHRFAGLVRGLGVPALLAGQVFEHLTEHPTPTRSEICAAYDALARGYAGFVLSDETAVGVDPVEACRVAAMFRAAALA